MLAAVGRVARSGRARRIATLIWQKQLWAYKIVSSLVEQ